MPEKKERKNRKPGTRQLVISNYSLEKYDKLIELQLEGGFTTMSSFAKKLFDMAIKGDVKVEF